MIKNYDVKNTRLGFYCWQNFILLLFSMFSFLTGQTSSVNENTITITYPKVQVIDLVDLSIGNRTGDFHDPELVGTLTTPSIRVPMSVAWDGEYYYCSHGGSSANDYVYRFDEQFNLVDQQFVEVDSRGLVQNPADGELYIKDYAGTSFYRLNTDPFDGSVEFLYNFPVTGQQSNFTFSADGQYVLLNQQNPYGEVHKYEFSTGNFVEDFTFEHYGGVGIAHTGTYLLLLGSGSQLFAYNEQLNLIGSINFSENIYNSYGSPSYANGFCFTNTGGNTWKIWDIDDGMVTTLGCTDPYAYNYNENANVDDGSCTYPDNGDYALSFDGENDLVNLNQSIISSTQNTFVAIFKADETEHYDYDSGRPIYSQGASSSTYANYAVGLHSDGLHIELAGPSDNGVHQLTESLNFNSWYHLAVVFNSGQISTYLNGNLESVINVPFTSIVQNSHGSFIGNRWGLESQNNGEYKWDGMIEEIQIWDNALTAAQVSSFYDISPTGNESGLVGLWKFNSGSGDILYDHSGNQTHGTILGATWEEIISGCTDLFAENYNADANVDDGSCTYPENDEYSLHFQNGGYVSTGSWFQGINNDYTILVDVRINEYPDENEEYFILHRAHFHDKRIGIDQNTNTIFASDRGGQGIPYVQVDYSLDNINVGQWYKVAFSANNDSLKLFIDGNLVDKKERTFGNTNWTSSYYWSSLGGGGGYGGHPNVNINEISIWDVELNQSMIQSYGNTNLSGNEDNLTSYWNFNEGSGDLVVDIGPNGNNGMINGATWSSDVPEPILGCTDPYAENYNADANVDDGSCSGYPDNGDYSLNFDGSADVSISEKNINGTFEEFSFSSWVNVHDFGNDYTNEYIFDVGRSGIAQRIALGVNQDGFHGLIAGVDSDVFNVNANYPHPNQWVYVSMVWKGLDYAKIYINGDLIAETNDISNGVLTLNSDDPFKLGSRFNGQNHFLGKISDVSLWEIALTQEQIQDQMSDGLNGNEQNLLAYWKTNSGLGEVLYDHSGNQNHGTINGATWEEFIVDIGCTDPIANNYDENADVDDGSCIYPDNGNHALSFDGVDDFVSIPNLNYNEDFSFLGHIFFTNVDGNSNVFINGDGNNFIRLDGSGDQWKLGYNSETGANHIGNTVLPINQWSHVAVTRENGILSFYLNGQFDGSFNEDNSNINFSKIGKRDGSWNGSLDNFSVWDIALSQPEILEYISSPPEVATNGLNASWRFNSGEGNILYDHSGNQNHGTLLGLPFEGWLSLMPEIDDIEDQFIDEDQELLLPLSGYSDLGLLTYMAASDTSDVVVSVNENSLLTVTPATNWNGTSIINVTAIDALGETDTTSFQLEVLPVNDPPIITQILDQETDEDVPLRIPLEASDVDGDPFFFEVDYVTNDSVSVFVISNGDSLLMVPYPNWSGEVEINITVDDGFPSGTSTIFNLIVNSVDDEPFVDNFIEDQYFYEDFQEVWDLDLAEVFTDIDGDLTYSVVLSDPAVISAEVNDNLLVLSSIQDAEGQTMMDVTASNPLRASVTTSFIVTVFGENDAPVVADIEPLVMTEDTPYEFMSMASLVEAGNISDVDNTLEELTFHLHSETDHVHIEWDEDANSTPMIHTELDYYGPGSLTLCVSDEYEETCTTIGLNVDPVNDAPYFTSEMHAPVGVNMEFHLPLDVMDVDSEELFVTLNEAEANPVWVMEIDNGLHGTPDMLGEYPIYLTLSDGQIAIQDTFHLDVVNFIPEIVAIEDVPNDQGGRVYVNFHGSFMDNGVETGQSYSVFRMDMIENTEEWVMVQSGDAVGHDLYTYEVTTISDSTYEENGATEFMVVANMNNGIFQSDPMMGYSVDNIVPGVPGGLMAVAMDDNIQLSWDVSTDEDFQYFALEKATNMDFTEPEVIHLTDTSFTDVDFTENQTYYYRLAAVDHAGNTSNYSEVVEATVLSIDENMVPKIFALYQNYPNPFNPTTQIQYDLPEEQNVNIAIYDVMGRSIRSLMNENQSAGYYSIGWDAKNDMGEGVAAGMYIYTIQAGEFRATKKMVFLK